MIKIIKNTVPYIYVISNLNGGESVGTICKKELQKINQAEFRVEKVMQTAVGKLYFKWKAFDNLFNSWIDKMSYFQKPYNYNKKIKAQLELSNYATISNLKAVAGIDTSKFAKTVDLAGLKSNAGNLDIGKLQTNFADLSKLSNLVENDFVK